MTTQQAPALTPEGKELVAIITDTRVKRPAPVGPRMSNRPTTPTQLPDDCHARNVAHLRVGSVVMSNLRSYDPHGNLISDWSRNFIDRIKLVTDDDGGEMFAVTFSARTLTTATGDRIVTIPAATIRYRGDETLIVRNS